VVKAVVFDLDGTLVDTRSIVPAAYAATVAALGGPAVDASAVVATYPLGPTKAILEHFVARDVSAEEVESYYARLATAAPVEPYEGVTEALRALRKRVPVAVYTGAGLEASRILLGRAGLASFFDAVVGGDEVERPKPDPEGLLLAARRLGVAVEATAYVGDAPRDFEAARACGALAVAAAWGHEFAVADGADLVLREPSELVSLLPTVITDLDITDPAIALAVLELQRRSYRVEAELIGTDAIPPLTETEEELRTCGERFLGAFLDDRLAGIVSWKFDGETVDVHRLAVDPEFFRRGIGVALVRAVAAAEPAARRTIVRTGAENDPAKALYLGEGFVEIGEREVGGGVRVSLFERTRDRASGSN
jgi:HAD superfamily hydrolase (TIGR01509 family)